MEHGPSAISSASAMALSNLTDHSIESRKKLNVSSKRCESEQIIDVVETGDRDSREQYEVQSQRVNNQSTEKEANPNAPERLSGSVLDLEG